MTNTTTPAPQPDTLCEACAGIQQHWRGTAGHPELVQGLHRKVEHSHGLVTITSYRCERCGSAWEYENNKCKRQAGWSLVPRKPA